MTSVTDLAIGNSVFISGQQPIDYFKVVTSSDGEFYFQWDYLLDVHYYPATKSETLIVTLNNRQIIINGDFLDIVALEFIKRRITYISPRDPKNNFLKGVITNVSVIDGKSS